MRALYTHGPGVDEPLAVFRSSGAGGGTFFYHADVLGSITALSDGTGAVVQSYTYDSFGNLLASTGSLSQPYTFTGQEVDAESGLYYYRARYYDPTLGRFLQEDPIGFDGGMNFYTYVEDNPLNQVDPFGLQQPTPADRLTCLANPLDCIKARACRDEALAETFKSFRRQGHNDAADAFRHCYWSCCMAKAIGASQAKKFGDAHEENPGQSLCEKSMDLFNNEQGRGPGPRGPAASCSSHCSSVPLKESLQEPCCTQKGGGY